MTTLNHSAVFVEATRADIHQLVRIMVDAIGAPLVQILSGAQDNTAPHRWAHPESTEPDTLTEERLRLGYRVWLTLQSADDHEAALAWLREKNPVLDDERPVDFVYQQHAQQVVHAAESWVSGTPTR
ncbi:MAG: hypothetical protein ABWX89_05915 [Paeniglutamicibacter terrestris]